MTLDFAPGEKAEVKGHFVFVDYYACLRPLWALFLLLLGAVCFMMFL